MSRYKTHKLPGAVLALLLCLLVSACSESPQAPLRVGTNVWQGYESLYVARKLGYLDAYNIHLVELPTATNVIHSFRMGNLEAATLTLDETLTLLQDNIKLKIVLIMDVSNGADALLAQPDIRTLSELKGRRIGYENTAVGAILLNAALDKAKLTPADVVLIPTSYNHHLNAFRSNKVDAIVTFEPARTRLLNEGATQLFNSSQIPGKIVDILVVSEAAAASHRDDIKGLVQSHFKALNYFSQHPEEGAKLMTARLGISATEILRSFEGLQLPNLAENKGRLQTTSSSVPPPLQKTAAELAELMLGQQLLTRLPALETAFTGDFLPEAEL